MTILEMIVDLLELHGIDGRQFDRIDVALDALYKAEMGNKKSATVGNSVEPEKKSRKKAVIEEHVGI